MDKRGALKIAQARQLKIPQCNIVVVLHMPPSNAFIAAPSSQA